MKAPAASPKLLALTRLIGATPLLEIHCRYRGREQRIYAKHEAYNFTGSIKDRMALSCSAPTRAAKSRPAT